uniref:Nicotinamide riboside kinase 1 n=1 Tax=Gadus morhua TaxID=8049 RepID=A0A8C5BK59_GADMO
MYTLTLVVGIGGVTNGGKSTLATNLQKKLPHSCIIAQDTFFKDDSVVPVDSNGFKQYDLLDALHMDKMMEEIYSWWRDPQSYHQSTCATTEAGRTEVFVVIVEGFLIFNHRPLNELMNKKYFLEIPYDECQNRRCSRVYTPPDPPGYFDGHVWPMYLKNRQEMQLGTMFVQGSDLMKNLVKSFSKRNLTRMYAQTIYHNDKESTKWYFRYCLKTGILI